jgi:hypothetical protein
MADPSYISRSVAMSLAMVSGGTCYWPDPRCMKPVTEDVNGDKVLSVQIAHIRAARPDGPRYVKDMTDHDRRRFGTSSCSALLITTSSIRLLLTSTR